MVTMVIAMVGPLQSQASLSTAQEHLVHGVLWNTESDILALVPQVVSLCCRGRVVIPMGRQPSVGLHVCSRSDWAVI